MNIVVILKLVPDLVEEITVADSGTALDTDWLRLIISEADNHALEQAILLKEGAGGHVTVIAQDAEDVDGVLYAAGARGADRLVKLVGSEAPDNHVLAKVVAASVGEATPDLILTGVQAHSDLDGPVGPLVAEALGLPYVGYVAGVSTGEAEVVVRKEFPGGLIAEMEVALPAVLGIQAAEEPPRYVAVSKIRQAMKTAELEEEKAATVDAGAGVTVSRMYVPDSGERATMLEGDEEEVAASLIGVLKELGAL
jgi:electron transfer flavoprotein beta subunit